MEVIKQAIIIDLNKMYCIIDVNKIQNCCRNKQNFAHGALSVHSCFHIKSNNITLEKNR